MVKLADTMSSHVICTCLRYLTHQNQGIVSMAWLLKC